jgi:ribose 5-phosphate isomerase RpiB
MLIQELVRAFVGATYTGQERHQRRLNKVLALENSSDTSSATSGG